MYMAPLKKSVQIFYTCCSHLFPKRTVACHFHFLPFVCYVGVTGNYACVSISSLCLALLIPPLWDIGVHSAPFRAFSYDCHFLCHHCLCFCFHHCQGALTQPPGPPRMKNKTTKTWSTWGGKVANLSKEKGLEPFPPWAFIRFIHIEMQVKLINHFQPIIVKQYKIYRELWGIILSYSQLVRGL